MHRNRLALFLMSQVLIVCMSGCGKADDGSKQETSTIEVSTEEQSSEIEDSSEVPEEASLVEEPSSAEETGIVEEPESIEESPVVEEPEDDNYYIQECQLVVGMNSTFSDDRAWYSYYLDDTTLTFGMIDTDGNVIFELPEEFSDIKGMWYNSTFSNGTSCLFTEEGSKDSIALIINKDGEIVFNSREYDDTIPFVFLWDADGKYLFYITREDFYDSKSYVLVVNNDGSISGEIEAPYFGRRLFFNSYGAGIFTCGSDYTINTNTNSIIELGYSSFRSKVFSDNTVLIADYGIISIDNIASQDIWDAYKASHEKDVDYLNSYSPIVYEDPTLGLYSFNGDKYYQYQMGTVEGGDPIVTLPYGGSSNAFYDGYAVVYMVGADEKEYIGLIDTNGNLQYDPVAIKAWNMWTSYHANDIITKGYIYAELEDDSRVIITPTGCSLTMGVDDTSSIPKDVLIGSEEKGITVSNGVASLNMYSEYVRQNYFNFEKSNFTGFYNLGTNEVITKAKRKVKLEQ